EPRPSGRGFPVRGRGNPALTGGAQNEAFDEFAVNAEAEAFVDPDCCCVRGDDVETDRFDPSVTKLGCDRRCDAGSQAAASIGAMRVNVADGGDAFVRRDEVSASD